MPPPQTPPLERARLGSCGCAPQPPTPGASRSPQEGGGPFFGEGYPVPPPLPADPSPHPCNQPREGEGRRAGISGAWAQAVGNRRQFESRPASVRCVTLGHTLTLSGLHTASSQLKKPAAPSPPTHDSQAAAAKDPPPLFSAHRIVSGHPWGHSEHLDIVLPKDENSLGATNPTASLPGTN